MDRNNRHGKRHHNSWKNQKPHTEYKEPVRYTNFQHITQEEFENEKSKKPTPLSYSFNLLKKMLEI